MHPYRLLIAAFILACIAVVSACESSKTPSSIALSSLQEYQAGHEPLLLDCEKLAGQPSHTERVMVAKLYAGGTWEIHPAEKPPLDSVVYYQQQPGENCRVWSRDESCAADKVRFPNAPSLCEALDKQ